MTDNEIKKALECCASEYFLCEECCYEHLRFNECTNCLSKDVLDLINRQQAEIERLTLEYAGFEAGVKQFAIFGKMVGERVADTDKTYRETVGEC